MRSPKEITFRLRQEGGNFFRLIQPPHANCAIEPPLAGLPGPAAVAAGLIGTPYATNVVLIAESVLAHRFPLLGSEVNTGPAIDWRRDYASGKSSDVNYFRCIPYLDFETVGDHKIIWEINRHQHLVLLAQAWRLSGRPEFIDEIETQLESWWGANPYGHGINWASALEVAFRALSWIWVFHIAGEAMSAAFRRRFLDSLYAHGRHIAGNLSVYFSPNTHLMGEAVALHAIGTLFPEFPDSARWRHEGGDIVRAQMRAQVQADGSHFEHSSYYHGYAFDMLMFAAAIENMPADYHEGLARMAEYLDALRGPQRRLPYFGDDDGGRIFHPYGSRERYGCASLAAFRATGGKTACATGTNEDYAEIGAWWLAGRALGPDVARRGSRYFENSGIAVMENGDLQLVADAGRFGFGRAGHSHSDTLSFILRLGDEDLLIDAGTYTYVASAKWRNWFRGSAAHNTIRIDGLDQATPGGPFRWDDKPEVELAGWKSDGYGDFLGAVCRYRGFEHLRRIQYVKPSLIVVVDDVTGPPGEHLIEQFWHSGEAVTGDSRRFRLGRRARLLLSHAGEVATGGENGWRSRAMGSKEPAAVIRVAIRSAFPVRLTAAIDLDGDAEASAISAAFEQLGVERGGAFG